MNKPPWMVHKCWECLHYQPMIDDNKGYMGRGMCKEEPPRVVVAGESVQETMVQMAGSSKQKIKQVHIDSYHSLVPHNWPACGHFELMPEKFMILSNDNGAEGEATA